MLHGTQVEVKIADLLDTVLKQIDPKELDFYVPARDWVIIEPKVDTEVEVDETR